jgi:hypothetical protein
MNRETHRGPRKKIGTGLHLAEDVTPAAVELIRALILPTSDPRHVCGPECFEEHKCNS